ncbi:hypothetical protein NQ314_007599 [Rhamnusium bicolor]|uniref:Peroxisomal ATPase PEX1 n=1 Tax=Rhamnusium bicolor TaxID=1586634 RepID=A0AAV8YLI2_9CUCU|nr:hypothetical protein NQ314_007599 [Rhamnusium bicolor]
MEDVQNIRDDKNALGIQENELVTLSEIPQLPTVDNITIFPLNTEDYDVLEILAENVQSTLLDQIRVVNNGQKIVVWVGNINVVVYLENVKPVSPGIIDFLTEVVIKPHTDIKEEKALISKAKTEAYGNSIFDMEKIKSLPNFFSDLTESKNSMQKYFSDKEHVIFRLVPLMELPFGFDLNLGENLFINNVIFKKFDCQLGGRVVLTHIDETPFVNEINIYTKKNYLLNVEEKFKAYLVKNSEDVLVMNPDVVIDIGDNIKCSLKFSPVEAKFCIVDDNLVRNCKYVIHEEVIVSKENCRKISISDKFAENVSNYASIINQVTSSFSVREDVWENSIITGKPGTGKSTLLKIIAEKLISYPNFIYTKIINCKKIKGKTVDSLFKLFSTEFSQLILSQPSVLILDDLHILCESVKGDEIAPNAIYSNRVGEMLHNFLKTFLKFNKIGICATVESISKLNRNIYCSRGSHLFKNLYSINDFTKEDRLQLLHYFFVKYNLVDVKFDDLSIKTEGFVVQDIVDFHNKTVFEAYKDQSDEDVIKINIDHFEKALKNTCVLSLQNVQLHSSGNKDFSDIGGLHEVKNILVESLLWPAQAPLRLQSGLLLYGPPGTGKTLLAAAAAKQCGLRLISIKGPELLSKFIGASEQAVRDVFQKAQSARPCILFFDEFDSLAPRRGHDNTGVTDRVVNQLLTQLDGVESLSGVCVLAATSRPDLLDPALLRPGRLDRQILCPLPDKVRKVF